MKFVLVVFFAALLGAGLSIGAKAILPAPAAVDQAPASAPVAVEANRIDGGPPLPSFVGPAWAASSMPAERGLWVEGTMFKGRKVWAYLSDGRVLRETTPGLQRVDAQGVVIDGVRIWMKPTEDPAQDKAGAYSYRNDESPVSVLQQALPQSSAVNTGPWRRDADGVERLVSGTGPVGVSTYRP